MNTSVIRHRVADFLKSHAPFDTLAEQDLLDLAGSGRVKFHESDEYVFRQGDAKRQFVWIIQQGRVELVEEHASGERLRDVLGEGDLLGLDRFAGEGACIHSARTASDVILYGVGAALFESLVARYPLLRQFIEARSAATAILGLGRTSWLDAEAPPTEFLRARLARNRMAEISAIPLPTIAGPLDTRAAVREMLQARAESLAVTADGTSNTPLEGILTADELALFCGHNPARLIAGIRHAESAAELAPLLRLAKRLVLDGLARPHDVDDCSRIASKATTALADACIALARRDTGAAPQPAFCCVMLGAAARGDLLDPGIPAMAMVHCRPEETTHFAALASEATGRFHENGLAGSDWMWPEGAHPSMPLSEWKLFYSETIRNPVGCDVYARREFFDLRSFSGDASLLSDLQDHIRGELREHEVAVKLLANDTLEHMPPLTFFRGLVLELDGAQRSSFDIARSAIVPITDAARVFALAKGHLHHANTLQRLETAHADFPEGGAILRDAAEAFRIAVYYQSLAGGASLDPAKLGKFDQILLKSAFVSIQHLLEFTTATFMRSA